MKVLFFGDVFAKAGRRGLDIALQKLTEEHEIDFIVVNGENMTHGKCVSPDHAKDCFNWGVDVITTGNHAWDNHETLAYYDIEPRLIRPANFPQHPMAPNPGKGVSVVQSRKNPKLKLGVISLIGRVFMDPVECPFLAFDKELADLRSKHGNIPVLVDFHAEASSEKQSLGYYADGKVSAVVGSHQHVQTADERILPKGTATITDVGMTGCFDSVIGNKKEISIQKFLNKRPARYEPAEGPAGYGCVIITIDPNTGRSTHILRLREENVERKLKA